MRAATAAFAFVLASSAHAADLPEPARNTCDGTRTYCFGIHLHVADGASTPAWFDAQLAVANRLFADVSVGFEVIAVDAHATAHVVTRADRAAYKRYVRGRVVHVFVTGALDNVDQADQEIRGVTLRAGDAKYIILSAKAPDRVLAHELGHVFGLPHSDHAISIMNKTERAQPPVEQRTFAPEEVALMTVRAKQLVRERVYSNRHRP